ncbi:MAG: four helix bundle protein [Patescibacteria group bacterium]
MSDKIKEFTDLIVWKEGHKLVLVIYTCTKAFPREETYSLTDQLRRAATSVTSNIAEGFGRHSYKERLQFYYMAQGSLTELKNQLHIAKGVGYLSEQTFSELLQQSVITHKLLQGLIKKTKTFLAPNS